MKIILIYTPCRDPQAAQKIAATLLQKKLIACANFWTGESLFLEKTKIKKTRETYLLCKTQVKNFQQAKKTIQQLHSYETPAILKIAAQANQDFGKWLTKNLQ